MNCVKEMLNFRFLGSEKSTKTLSLVDVGASQVVQDQKNPAFLAKRKTDLEAYLKEVGVRAAQPHKHKYPNQK